MITEGKAEVIAGLRWLADQPGGVPHRALLFRAAWLLQRDEAVIFASDKQPIPALTEQRSGDSVV